MRNALKRTAARLPLLLAVVAGIVFLAFGGARFLSLASLADNARALRQVADDWGKAAPLLFIAVNGALLMLLVVPAWFCAILGGLLFGRWLGLACALIGTTLGASGVFLMARAGLEGLAERAGPRAARVAEGFRNNALSYLVFLRLVPLIPFSVVNFAAALARLKLGTLMLGTLIGIVPSALIYASLGDLLMDLARRGELPESNLLLEPRFLLPLLGLAALALLPIAVERWRRRR
ncbi:MAG: VTT domain-containing protein [Reyranellaceae bacterium]